LTLFEVFILVHYDDRPRTARLQQLKPQMATSNSQIDKYRTAVE